MTRFIKIVLLLAAAFVADAQSISQSQIRNSPFSNVKDYGATGDGVTDDLAAITAALADATPYGVVYFPKGTYMVSNTVVVPNKVTVIGVGRGDPPDLVSGGVATTIKANASFPSNTPVVSLCSAPGPCFGVRVEDLAIDCNDKTGCIGGYNAYSQELSWFRRVLVIRAPAHGIFIDGKPGGVETYASQNSGPYTDLDILPLGSGTTNTTCIRATLVPSFRGIANVTCNADGYDLIPTNAIYVDGSGPTTISNIHIEHFTNGIVLGSATYGQNDTLIYNVLSGPANDTSVRITAPVAQGMFNITIIGVSNSTVGSNLLVDGSSSTTIASSTFGLGFYSLGNGAAGNQTILSTSNAITPIFKSPVTVLKNFSVPGTGADDSKISLGNTGQYYLFWNDSVTSGEPGPVLQTGGSSHGKPCLLIQTNAVTAGATGGGACINGNGYDDQPDWAAFGAGYTGDMGTLIARAATPAGMFIQDGVFDFLSATGQTPGSATTMTSKFRVNLDGTARFTTGLAFASLGTPADGTFVYCTDCTVTGAGDNTCAGSGTGALAIRLNGAWRCLNNQN